MIGLAFLENINSIDDDLISEAESWVRPKARNPRIPVCIMTIAACLCLALGLGYGITNNGDRPLDVDGSIDSNTVPSFDKVYPTVMVNGKLYEWKRSDAVIDSLPVGCVYYGKINRIDNNTPKNNCEFVSSFSANGEVFIDSTVNLVYIIITTDWLNDSIVIFEPVIDEGGHPKSS